MRLRVVLPEGYAERPSGGNEYDRRICAGLAARGWDVRITTIPGPWLPPGARVEPALVEALDAAPAGATVLVDGLIASPAARVVVPRAERLRLAVLLHMPLATAVGHGIDDAARVSEYAVLSAAEVVIVPSRWTQERLVGLGHPPDRVVVATPGVDPVPRRVRPLSSAVPRLLCVGAVARHKGQDVLVEALAAARDRAWTCALVGALDSDPDFVRALRDAIEHHGLGGRIRLVGPLPRPRLEAEYERADLLLHPSRGETYGMVVAEALAHGLPVIASDVGGLPEALGQAPAACLVPPDDPAALAQALTRWLDDPRHRDALLAAAARRAPTLPTWDDTTARISEALGRPDTTRRLVGRLADM